MTVACKIKRGFSKDGQVLDNEESISVGANQEISESIPDSSTDLEVACVLDVSQCTLIYMESDQDVTIETNDGTTPDDTISLSAGKARQWTAEDGAALRPLTTDVTALFVTNSSGAAAQLEIRLGYDPTV